jgi:hypothetical protein
MNRQRLISLFNAMLVLIFLLTLSSSVFAVEPTTFPTNRTAPKIKTTVPTPAPPVLVAPTKTKAPAHKPAVSAGTPKPTPPKVSVKQPKPSTPKVSVIKPKLSAPRPATAPASLPPSIGRSGLPPAHIPRNLGKAVNIQRDLGKTNSISGRMPAGHNTPATGFGSTGGAADLAKGFSQRDGVGSVEDNFPHLFEPTLRTGKGAHIQGQDSDESPEGLMSKGDTNALTTAILGGDPTKGSVDSVINDILGIEKPTTLSESDADAIANTILDNTGTESTSESKKNAVVTAITGEKQQERTADDGSGAGGPGGPVDPDRVKSIFAGSPGIRFAPGEDPAGEGPVDPGRLGEIQSSQTQIHTFDGGVPKSINVEDFSEIIQDAVKSGGQGNPIIE